MNKPSRVAILHYAGPPIIGGVEATIGQHAQRLTDRGFRVHILAGRGQDFDPRVQFINVPEIDSRHPEVLEVGKQLSAGEISAHFYNLRNTLVQKLGKLLAEVEVCIVHNALTLHKNMALTAALERLLEELPFRLVAWCHDFAWQDPLYLPDLHEGYPWDLLRQAWPGVQYIAVSESRQRALSDLLGLPAEQIQVVTPGIDVFEFLSISPLTQKLVNQMDLSCLNPLILLPARITRRKNIEFAIRVVAALRNTWPLANLVVTGPPGPHNPKNIAYLRSLNQLSEELSIRPYVHFLYEFGDPNKPLNLPDDAVAGLYRLADILIFPSLREGFGIPILEAGLARLPVFAADIPPIQASAGQTIHMFDPQGDPQAVAHQISTFLEQDQAYQLKQRVVSQYSWDAIVDTKLIPLIKGNP